MKTLKIFIALLILFVPMTFVDAIDTTTTNKERGRGRSGYLKPQLPWEIFQGRGEVEVGNRLS